MAGLFVGLETSLEARLTNRMYVVAAGQAALTVAAVGILLHVLG